MTTYEIFRAAFPQLELSEADFNALTQYDRKFTHGNAFAMVRGENITLICAAPEEQGKGTGTRLLKQCEDYLRKKGYTSARLGGEFFCGAVSESWDFFVKHGYRLGDTYCEMYIDLENYSDQLPDSSVHFGFLSGRRDELIAAVNSVDREWAQYFTDGEFFCAADDTRIYSFCIVDDNVQCVLSPANVRVGSVGCVGTIPSARSKGTGLKMVSLALEELKRRGCGRCYIHWTHLDKWYGKLGARTAFQFRTGEKEL